MAIDLTLTRDGKDLDMGTEFDEFSPLSYHGNRQISELSFKNRLLLLGIMTDAGWDFLEMNGGTISFLILKHIQ